MCSPPAIAAVALMAAGTHMQNEGVKKDTKARNSAAEAEQIRQDSLREQAAGVFDDTLSTQDRSSQEAAGVGARRKRNEAVDRALEPSPDLAPGAPVSGSAPKVVKSTIAKAVTDAMSEGRREGKAQANLQSFGDLAFLNDVDIGRGAQQTAQIGDFSRGSSAVLPLEFMRANQAGNSKRSFGQLLSMGGQAAGMAGGAGMGPSWGDLGFGSMGRTGYTSGIVGGGGRMVGGV
jgi:hypothetical protein